MIIDARPSQGTISLSKTYADYWMQYHITVRTRRLPNGTTWRLPQRNPLGYSSTELGDIRGMLGNHVRLNAR